MFVTRPLAFTVNTGTCVAEPYVVAVSPEIVVKFVDVIEPAPTVANVEPSAVVIVKVFPQLLSQLQNL